MKKITFTQTNDGNYMAIIGKRSSYTMSADIKEKIENLQSKGMSMTINEINSLIIASQNGTRMYHASRTNSIENKKHMF